MRMSLSLFDKEYVEALAICGAIRGDEAESLRPLVPKEPKRLQCCQQSAQGPVWMRLIVNWSAKMKGVHFHIDTATEASFDDEPPTDGGDEDEINRLFDVTSGRAIDFYANTRFVVPRKALKKNSVVNLLLGVSVGPHGEVSLDGVEYKIASGPVDRLQWRLFERDEAAFVKATAIADSSGIVGSDLLGTVYEPMASVFRALIMEEGVA
jgi:hypothetical protein